ncbi:hypothetical protein Tco_0906284 [Tanacetum coccineum]
MRKTPQEAYDLIENMTQHHFHAQIEVLRKQTAYTIQSVQHQPGPGHPNTVYYSDSDESDKDEPSEVLEVQRSIHPLIGNPTPSFDSMVESLSPLPTPFEDSDSLLEESDTLLSYSDDSSPEYETFYFDDDHIGEKSSGSTTTHSDFSLPEYDSFIFDLSINPLPLAGRSDFYHEEFANELDHIISPPEYDYFYFYFDSEADLREFTRSLEKDLIDLSTKEFTSIKLNDSSFLLYDCDSSLSKEFSEINLLVSFLSGNEDIIFDPGIIIEVVQIKRFQIPLKFFSTIAFESYPLFFTEHPEIDTLTSFPFGNEDKVFNPGILISKGFHSRHSLGLSHRVSEAFKINKKFKSPMEIFTLFFYLYDGGDISSLDVPYLYLSLIDN